MGDLSLDTDDDYEEEDVSEYIEKHSVSGIEELFKATLEIWKDVEINIGVTGDSGVGKTSFINAIRGLAEDDELAAPVGVTETTREPAVYPHPTNKKIFFWNLSCIGGTPNYPTLEDYCEKVGLEKYDIILILTASRFTENALLLARKVKLMEKSFFFIRTMIDVDVRREKRKTFDEEAMLKRIRKDCFPYLKELEASDEDVFLINNHETAKWDFARLTKAILDVKRKVSGCP